MIPLQVDPGWLAGISINGTATVVAVSLQRDMYPGLTVKGYLSAVTAGAPSHPP